MTTSMPVPTSAVALFDADDTKKRFSSVLGAKGPAFLASVASVYSTTKALQTINPASIINAAVIAASLDLPINPNLGFAAIVPYNGEATFQIMWKGFVQLAYRTKQYSKVHLARIYEGQLVRRDRIAGEFVFNESAKKSDLVEGYYFFFKLKGSDEKIEFYWSARECVAHGLKYSQSFQKGQGKWTEDPHVFTPGQKFDIDAWDGLVTESSGTDAMCAKTIVKMSLSKWGPLSTEIQKGVEFDQAAVTPDGRPKYVDGTAVRGGEVTEAEVPMPKQIASTDKVIEDAKAVAAEKARTPAPTQAVGKIAKGSTTTITVKGKDVGVNKITLEGQTLPFVTEDDGVAKLAKKIKEDGAIAVVDFEARDGHLWITMLARQTQAA